MASDKGGGQAGRAQRHAGGRALDEAVIKRSIADAVVTKDEDVFMISQPNGDVPVEGEHGFGLYFHDCRYLSGYTLALDGTTPVQLDADGSRGFAAGFALTSGRMKLPDGSELAPRELGIERERVIDAAAHAVHEIITLRSYTSRRVEIDLSIVLRAEFEDVFVVRGFEAAPPSQGYSVASEGDGITFTHQGLDGTERRLDARFSPAPTKIHRSAAVFRVALDPRASARVLVILRISERPQGSPPPPAPRTPDVDAVVRELHRDVQAWIGRHARVTSSSKLLDAVVHRSVLDLRLLRHRRDDLPFFSAGVPWYATLFGRDSLLTALEILAFEPGMAEDTLRLLAREQGDEDDPERDEEPGKMPHELRRGELARAGRIPFTPYYGTVDATLLFLILLASHAAWTGRLDLFRELRQNADRAIAWIEHNLATSPTGFVSYAMRSSHGVYNQGWKDSRDGVVDAQGNVCRAPIALCEVQGYAYLAFEGMAGLHERDGDADRAFWVEDRGVWALALHGDDGARAEVVTSNAGQVLWSGIAGGDHARRVAARLFEPDLWSGWGVRTLSMRERCYQPVGYHLGTVWPHDNAIIAAGLRRHGEDDAACRVLEAVLDLADHYPYHRLPELVSGYGRDAFARPIRYPVACHPQAWAAGSVPFMITSLLGLSPDGFASKLRVVRPVLPAFVRHLTIEALRVGDAQATLRFSRRADGALDVEARDVSGKLDVEVEPAQRSSE
jgi:glycogen debranching enzyme